MFFSVLQKVCAIHQTDSEPVLLRFSTSVQVLVSFTLNHTHCSQASSFHTQDLVSQLHSKVFAITVAEILSHSECPSSLRLFKPLFNFKTLRVMLFKLCSVCSALFCWPSWLHTVHILILRSCVVRHRVH